MYSYNRLDVYLGQRSDRPAPETRNNTRVQRRGDDIAVRLHNTDVLTFTPSGDVILNSGGWRTPTTKGRMNEYIGPWQVWQSRGVWYLGNDWLGKSHIFSDETVIHSKDKGDGSVSFADGVTIHSDGSVTGEGDDPAEMLKLVKSINQYSKRYAAAFVAGDVPPPDGGDCWYCSMFDAAGVDDTSHLLSHIEEGYFVPSLLNLVKTSHLGDLFSIAAEDYIARTWAGMETGGGWADIAQGQIEGAVKRYLKHRLGVAS